MHGTQSSEAGRGVQVEHQVRQRGNLGDGKYRGNLRTSAFHKRQFFRINQVLKANEADGQGAHHIFLGNEAGDGSGSQLPGDHAHDGHQQVGKGTGNGGQNGVTGSLGNFKTPGEGLHDLHNGVADQNDGKGFDDECPAPGAHIHDGALQRRNLILGQFHDEEGFAVLVAGNFIDQQRAQQNQGNAHKIHERADPGSIRKECARE